MTRTDICNSSDLVIVHIRESDELIVYMIIMFFILLILQFAAFRRIQYLEEALMRPVVYHNISDTSEDDPTDPTRHQ